MWRAKPANRWKLKACGQGAPPFEIIPCFSARSSPCHGVGARMKEPVHTGGAPKAIGPYSQVIEANGMVFASGQIPLDQSTGELVEVDIGRQTERVLNNLKAVLESAGSSLQNVVRTTVYLADLGDFAEMNAAYARF